MVGTTIVSNDLPEQQITAIVSEPLGGDKDAQATRAARRHGWRASQRSMTGSRSRHLFVQDRIEKNDNGVKSAKGTWTSEVIVRDNRTGTLESFALDSGKFKTDSKFSGVTSRRVMCELLVTRLAVESGRVMTALCFPGR